ncbi:MAG: ATP-binding cassette domain-containing protein [Alphaproteobacteria bacterium]|nr:ATP-binding cassette domain-containing protein [Alphaproteobacteria bacterium]
MKSALPPSPGDSQGTAPASSADPSVRDADPVVRAQGLVKSFDDAGRVIRVLNGASIMVGPGERVAITGESGCGKSTFLHVVAGLEPFDDGEVIVAGQRLAALSEDERTRLRRSDVAVVFQQFNLIPSLTVRDNVAFQARIAGRWDPAWGEDLMRRLGVDELASRYPEKLSGGQQQRVAIARALAVRPKILMADEPTGNLDEATSEAVVKAMNELVRFTGAALLMVTHSNALAARLDRRLRLSGGVFG